MTRKPRKPNTLEYRDTFVTVFNDDEKLLVIFVTDTGHTKAVNYDDNFFYVEYLIETYLEMILISFAHYAPQESKEEIKEHVKKFIKHLERKTEIDRELFSEELAEILK